MGVYLLAVRVELNKAVVDKSNKLVRHPDEIIVTDFVTWLFSYMRGDTVHVKLYFDSLNQFLYINMRTITAKFIPINFELTENVKFYKLEKIDEIMEAEILTYLKDPEFLKKFIFSKHMFMNSAAPINNPNFMVKFINVYYPNTEQPDNDTKGDFKFVHCPALIIEILKLCLPLDNKLRNVSAEFVSASDLVILAKRHLGATEILGSLIYKKQEVKLGFEEMA